MSPKGFSGNADMERNLKRVRLGPWLGGIDEKSAPWAVPDGKFSAGQNLLLDEVPGYAIKRNGSRHISDLPSGLPGRDGAVFGKANGTSYLLASDGVNLYYTTDPSISASWTLLKTGLNTDGFMEFETAEDKIWMTNGVNNVMSWDATTLVVYDREKTVTIDNTSTGTTTVVNTQLTEDDDYWNGQKLVFTAGANVGTIVTVTDFVKSTHTITFTPAISGGAVGDRFKVGLIIPIGRAIRFWDSHLWITSTTENLAEARYQSLTDPNTGVDITIDHPLAWPSTNQIDVYSSDGDRVWGISPICNDRISFYKSTGIFRCERDPLTQYHLEVVSRSIGSRFVRSWAEKNGDLVFVGQDKDGLPEVYKTNQYKVTPVDDSGGLEPTLRALQQPNQVQRDRVFASAEDFDAGTLSTFVDTSAGTIGISGSGLLSSADIPIISGTNIDIESTPGSVAILGQPIWEVKYEGDVLPNYAAQVWSVDQNNINSWTDSGILQVWCHQGAQFMHPFYTFTRSSDLSATKDTFLSMRFQIAEAYQGITIKIANGAKQSRVAFVQKDTSGYGWGESPSFNGVAIPLVSSGVHVMHLLLKADGTNKLWLDGSLLSTTSPTTTTENIVSAHFDSGYYQSNSIKIMSLYYHTDFKGDSLDSKSGKISPVSLPATLPTTGEIVLQNDFTRAPDSINRLYVSTDFAAKVATCGVTGSSLTVQLALTTDMTQLAASMLVYLRSEVDGSLIANGSGRVIQSVDPATHTIALDNGGGVVTTDATVGLFDFYGDSIALSSYTSSSVDFSTGNDPAGYVTVGNGALPTSLAKRYQRIKIGLTGSGDLVNGPAVVNITPGILWVSEAVSIGVLIAAWRTMINTIVAPSGTNQAIQIRRATVTAAPIETDWGAWHTIVSGNNIGTILSDTTSPPTSRWVQIKVEEGPSSIGLLPYVDNMILQWVEGGANILPLMGLVHKKRYQFCAATATSPHNDLVVVSDRNDAWMKYIGLSLNFMAHFQGQLIGYSSSDDNILLLDSPGLMEDQGVAIDAYLTTREEIDKAGETRKDYRFGFVHVDSYTASLLVSMKRPADATFINLKTLSVDSEGGDLKYNFPFTTVAKRMQRKYQNATIGEDMRIGGETIYFVIRPTYGYKR